VAGAAVAGAVVAGAGGAALGEAASTIVPELTVVLQFGQPPDTTVPLTVPLQPQLDTVTGAEQPQLDTGAGAEHPQLGAGAGVEHPQDGAGAGAQHLGAGAQHFGAGGQQPLLRRPRAKLTSAMLETSNNAATPANRKRFIELSPFKVVCAITQPLSSCD
jgi:hypothetical protein